MIKKAAKQLLAGEHNFTEDFDHNKRVLKNTMPSKPIRNKIAGYIARLIRMQKIAKLAEQKPKIRSLIFL